MLRLDLPHQLVADLDLLGVRFAVFRLFRLFLYGREISEAFAGLAVKFEGEQFPVLILDLVEDGRFIFRADHDRRHLRGIDVFFRQGFHFGKRYVLRDLLTLQQVIDRIIEAQHGLEKLPAVADRFAAPDQRLGDGRFRIGEIFFGKIVGVFFDDIVDYLERFLGMRGVHGGRDNVGAVIFFRVKVRAGAVGVGFLLPKDDVEPRGKTAAQHEVHKVRFEVFLILAAHGRQSHPYFALRGVLALFEDFFAGY